jgi:hypothetical protein
MNHLVVLAAAAGLVAMNGGQSPEASLPTPIDAGQRWSVAEPLERCSTAVSAWPHMPEVRVDSYPAIRLEHESAKAPGVIGDALNGGVIQQGVVPWTGSAQPVDPERARRYFESVFRQQLSRGASESNGGPVYPIRNSMCNASGEIYGRCSNRSR